MVTKLLEEETLEEVGSIDDGENEHGGEVDGEDGVQQPLVRVGLLVYWFSNLLLNTRVICRPASVLLALL